MTANRTRSMYHKYGSGGAGQDHADEMMALEAKEPEMNKPLTIAAGVVAVIVMAVIALLAVAQ
jgi:hypothetical protein